MDAEIPSLSADGDIPGLLRFLFPAGPRADIPLPAIMGPSLHKDLSGSYWPVAARLLTTTREASRTRERLQNPRKVLKAPPVALTFTQTARLFVKLSFLLAGGEHHCVDR